MEAFVTTSRRYFLALCVVSFILFLQASGIKVSPSALLHPGDAHQIVFSFPTDDLVKVSYMSNLENAYLLKWREGQFENMNVSGLSTTILTDKKKSLTQLKLNVTSPMDFIGQFIGTSFDHGSVASFLYTWDCKLFIFKDGVMEEFVVHPGVYVEDDTHLSVVCHVAYGNDGYIPTSKNFVNSSNFANCIGVLNVTVDESNSEYNKLIVSNPIHITRKCAKNLQAEITVTLTLPGINSTKEYNIEPVELKQYMKFEFPIQRRALYRYIDVQPDVQNGAILKKTKEVRLTCHYQENTNLHNTLWKVNGVVMPEVSSVLTLELEDYEAVENFTVSCGSSMDSSPSLETFFSVPVGGAGSIVGSFLLLIIASIVAWNV